VLFRRVFFGAPCHNEQRRDRPVAVVSFLEEQAQNGETNKCSYVSSSKSVPCLDVLASGRQGEKHFAREQSTIANDQGSPNEQGPALARHNPTYPTVVLFIIRHSEMMGSSIHRNHRLEPARTIPWLHPPDETQCITPWGRLVRSMVRNVGPGIDRRRPTKGAHRCFITWHVREDGFFVPGESTNAAAAAAKPELKTCDAPALVPFFRRLIHGVCFLDQDIFWRKLDDATRAPLSLFSRLNTLFS
jgi:hypothetical protein